MNKTYVYNTSISWIKVHQYVHIFFHYVSTYFLPRLLFLSVTCHVTRQYRLGNAMLIIHLEGVCYCKWIELCKEWFLFCASDKMHLAVEDQEELERIKFQRRYGFFRAISEAVSQRKVR